MRKCVLFLLLCLSLLGLAACGGNGESASAEEAPELLAAVPSDALSVGLFSRLDKGLDRMLDSTSVLLRPDYGRLARAKAVVALCDIGSLSPLVIVEAGKHGADTLDAVLSVMHQAEELGLNAEQVELPSHNALLVSASPTVLAVVRRHLASESSILDAPHFSAVLGALGGQDAIVYRNSGASKVFDIKFEPYQRREVTAFLKDACEWTVLSGEKIRTVQPQSEKYYCNFMESLSDGSSKLSGAFPSGAGVVLDFPIASLPDWRRSYETWLDARVELESYNKRIQNLSRKTGKNPLNWEKELGIKEVAVVAAPGFKVNMIRVPKAKSSGSVPQVNPYTGFVAALYGDVFNAADSCMVYRGEWLLTGERDVIDTLSLGQEKASAWPAKARVAVYSGGKCLSWTNESIKVWDSNR